MKATHIAAGTATTVCHANACLLKRITINTKGASSNTLTVYDNTAGSGTVIAIIDTTAAAVTLDYDVRCQNGVTVVSATGTGADLTVVTA